MPAQVLKHEVGSGQHQGRGYGLDRGWEGRFAHLVIWTLSIVRFYTSHHAPPALGVQARSQQGL